MSEGNPEESASTEAKLTAEEEPPQIELPNVYPVEWRTESQRLADLYETAKNQSWNPSQIRWDLLNPKDYDDKQRIAMAYWWALLANFENSGAPVFAQAMIHTFETHHEDPVKKLLASIVLDECRHDECCMRACNRLCAGFPWNYKPRSDFENRALKNIQWVYYNGSRYWKGYQSAFNKYSFPIIFTPFMMGEKCAATLFNEMSKQSNHPAFGEALRNIARDESRHLAFTWINLENVAPLLTEEEKKSVTKQIRAGFVFLSMILYEPPKDFWRLPPDFLETHYAMEEIARNAGLGILTMEEKRRVWKRAILEVKKRLEGYNIEFPDLPEIGISGKEVTLDPNVLVTSF